MVRQHYVTIVMLHIIASTRMVVAFGLLSLRENNQAAPDRCRTKFLSLCTDFVRQVVWADIIL